MKVPCWNTAVAITRRSRETLASITQKTKEKLGIETGTESIEEWDEGTQRFAQTAVGRTLLRWSRPQEKRKKKRKFPVISVVFLGLFAMMVILSLVSHNSASAQSVQKSQVSSSVHTSAKSTSNMPSTRNGRSIACDANGTYALICNTDKCQGNNSHTCNAFGCAPGIMPSGDGVTGIVCLTGIGTAGAAPSFPCEQKESNITDDWLSGDTAVIARPLVGNPTTTTDNAGHLTQTYYSDTINQPNILKIYPYMLGLGLLLLGPTVILTGYQILFAASSFRYAEAITAISRVFLAGAAVLFCYYLMAELIVLSNTVSGAVVTMHGELGYPASKLTVDPEELKTYYIGYNLAVGDPTQDASNGNQELSDGTVMPNPAEPATSYRGIVVPIDRWGCAANDFVSIVSDQFWTNVFSSFIPFFGNFINMTDKITGAVAVVHHLGEFMETILSVGLMAQIFFRIVMLNFYILMGPVACGCWGLPGGTGQKVIGQWFKGFCSLLFVQAVQLFVLTVMPLILPDLTAMNLPADSWGLLQSVFEQLPVVLVLFVTLRVPNMMGSSATKVLTSAGTMASGAVTAAGIAVYSLA